MNESNAPNTPRARSPRLAGLQAAKLIPLQILDAAYQTTHATWRQTCRLTTYASGIWKLRTFQRAARDAELDLGIRFYSSEFGDPTLRSEIFSLDIQIKQASRDKKSTSRLRQERESAVHCLALSALNDPLATERYSLLVRKVNSIHAAVSQQETLLRRQRYELLPTSREERWGTGIGLLTLTVLTLFITSLFSATSERKERTVSKSRAEPHPQVQLADSVPEIQAAGDKGARLTNLLNEQADSVKHDSPRFPDGRLATIENGAPDESGINQDAKETSHKNLGIVEIEAEYVNKIAHGREIHRLRDGTLLLEVQWRLGWPTSKKSFHRNGKPQFEEHFGNNGTPHGTTQEWSDSGQLILETTWRNGARHGPYRSWLNSGEKFEERSYVDGLLDGAWLIWHKNGQLYQRVNFQNGLQHGNCVWFNADGQKREETEFANGLPHGKSWVFDFKKRMKSAGSYEHGVKVGDWFSWDQAGVKSLQGSFEVLKDTIRPAQNAKVQLDSKIPALAFAPSGQTIVVAQDEFVELRDIVSNRVRTNLSPSFNRGASVDPFCSGPTPTGCRFSPDGRTISVSCGGTIYVFDAESGKQIADMWWGHGGIRGKVQTTSFLPDGKHLISGGTGGVVLWNLESQAQKDRLIYEVDSDIPVLQDSKVENLMALPFNVVAVSGQRFGTAWDLNGRKPFEPLEGKLSGRNLFLGSLNQKELIVVQTNHVVSLNMRTGDVIWSTELGYEPTIGATSISKNGLLVIANGRKLEVRKANIGASLIFEVKDTGSRLTAVAISDDGTLVASGHEDKTLRFWDIEQTK